MTRVGRIWGVLAVLSCNALYTLAAYTLLAVLAINWYIDASVRFVGRTWRQARARVNGGDALQCTKCKKVQYGEEHQYCERCHVSATPVMYR